MSACTGLTARWCPVHGACICGPDGDMDDPLCPLHRPSGPHPSRRRRITVRRHRDYEKSIDFTTCPYFGRYHGLSGADPNGTCAFGCRDEPACVTGGPW